MTAVVMYQDRLLLICGGKCASGPLTGSMQTESSSQAGIARSINMSRSTLTVWQVGLLGVCIAELLIVVVFDLHLKDLTSPTGALKPRGTLVNLA